jgi:hypothetical protein
MKDETSDPPARRENISDGHEPGNDREWKEKGRRKEGEEQQDEEKVIALAHGALERETSTHPVNKSQTTMKRARFQCLRARQYQARGAVVSPSPPSRSFSLRLLVLLSRGFAVEIVESFSKLTCLE